MYVVGPKNSFFFSRVKIGQNWPAEFRDHRFVIGGGGIVSFPADPLPRNPQAPI